MNSADSRSWNAILAINVLFAKVRSLVVENVQGRLSSDSIPTYLSRLLLIRNSKCPHSGQSYVQDAFDFNLLLESFKNFLTSINGTRDV